MRRSVYILGLCLLPLLGCAGAGAQSFRAGEKAQKSGDLEAAYRHFGQAADAEPNNQAYREKKNSAASDLAESLVPAASKHEQDGAWAEASAIWGRVAEVLPSQSDYAVRRDLSGLKAENLGPDEWFDGVLAINKKHPDNEIIKRSLTSARKRAYEHNLTLAREALAKNQGRAFPRLQRAKVVDPAAPGIEQADLLRAEALFLMEQGDKKLADDPIAAYDLYQKAQQKTPLPQLKRKLKAARRKAPALLKLLGAARAKAARGRYKDAVRIYERLLRMKGAPKEARNELNVVRQTIVAEESEEAQRYAAKGDRRSALQSLERAIKSTALSTEARKKALAGLAAIRKEDPATGRKLVEEAQIAKGTPLSRALQQVLLLTAKAKFEKARKLAKRDPMAALPVAQALEPFAEDLPDLSDLLRMLQLRSFTKQLDAAFRYAKEGKDDKAAELILQALSASQAPKSLSEAVTEACGHLEEGRFARAEGLFLEAKKKAPRSRLANWGVEISRFRRGQVEVAAAKAIERGDDRRAVFVLADSLDIDPKNEHVKRARDTILDRIVKKKGKLSDAAVAIGLWRGALLTPLPDTARSAVREAAKKLRSGDHKGALLGFNLARKHAPNARVVLLGHAIVSRKTGASESRDVVEIVKRGDALMVKNDATRALTQYQKAYGLNPSPQLKQKMDAAQRVKQQLEAARSKLAAGRLEEALDLYDELLASNRNPTLVAEAAKVRSSLVRSSCDQSIQFLVRGDLRSADKALKKALQAAELPEANRARALAGLAEIKRGYAGEGLREVEAAVGEPFIAPAKRLANAAARRVLVRAKALVEKDPAQAQRFVDGLAGLDLPELKEIRRRLRKGTLQTKLDRALELAKSQKDRAAARLLIEALPFEAPALLRKKMTEACKLLSAGKHLAAEKVFLEAVAVAPKSRFANRGVEIARWRKDERLRAATTVLERGQGNAPEAVRLLAEALAVSPQNPYSKRGADALLAHAEQRSSNVRAAAGFLIYALRLTPISTRAAAAIQEAANRLRKEDYEGARIGFAKAQKLAPSAKVAALGLRLAEQRMKKARVADAHRALIVEGDRLMSNGDPLGALDRYQKAHQKNPSRALKRKVRKAKKRSAPLLRKLQAARKKAKQKKYSSALKLYSALLGTKGVALEQEMTAVREKLVLEVCEKANRYSARLDLKKARRELRRGIEHAGLDPAVRRSLFEGLDELKRMNAAAGWLRVQNAGISVEKPLGAAIKNLALAVAKKQMKRARSLARKNPDKAKKILAALGVFATDLPEAEAIERKAKVQESSAQLEKAERSARTGDDEEAARLLRKAADGSAKGLIEGGCDHLAAARHRAAEGAFARANKRDPKSLVAKKGLEIARLRIQVVERSAAETVESGKGDLPTAINVLVSAVQAEPGNPYAARGAKALLEDVERNKNTYSDGKIALLLRQACRMVSQREALSKKLHEASSRFAAGDYKTAEAGFVKVLGASPASGIAKLGVRLSAERNAVSSARMALEQLVKAADEKMRQGDALGAQDLYQRAYKKEPSAALSAKIEAAKAKAAPLTERLKRARAAHQKAKYKEAIELYRAVAKMPGAPNLSGDIKEVERLLVGGACQRSEQLTARKDFAAAARQLVAAVPHAGLTPATQEQLRQALAEIGKQNAGRSYTILKSLTKGPLLHEATEKLALAQARSMLTGARAVAKRKPSAALMRLQQLTGLESELPEIIELRKVLDAGALEVVLSRAAVQADRGDDKGAAATLKRALNESKEPAASKKTIAKGCDQLALGQHAEAEQTFRRVLANRPGSIVALRGASIAKKRHERAEFAALRSLEKWRKVDRSVAVLAKAKAIDPQNPSVNKARKIVLSRVKRLARKTKDKDLAILIGHAVRLSPLPEVASRRMMRGLEHMQRGDHAAAEKAFFEAGQSSLDDEVIEIALALVKRRLLAALSKGKIDIDSGGEPAARAMAVLIKKKPNDETLLEVVNKLVKTAQTHATAGRRSEAARLVGLAIIASAPNEVMAAELNRGHAALTSGKLDGAERSFGKALEMDPANAVARGAYELSQTTRIDSLVEGVMSALGRGRAADVKSLLDRPAGLDGGGKKVFDAVLGAAKREGALGNDQRAAELLDAANVRSAGELRQLIATGNSHLAKSEYAKANRSYEAAMKKKNKVAAAGSEIAYTRQVTQLLAGVAELKNIGDLERGAKATAEILFIDPKDSDGRAAVKSVMDHALEQAKSRNKKKVLRALRAGATALGEEERMGLVLKLAENGDHRRALAAFRRFSRAYEKESEDPEEEEEKAAMNFGKMAAGVMEALINK